MNSVSRSLMERFQQRSAKIAVLGLGYVGLPLATLFAEAGFEVTGVEPDSKKVEALMRGESYVLDVPSEQLARLVASSRLRATTDFSALKDADAVSICVPTPLRKTGDPDLSFILEATDKLARQIHPGMVVVLNRPLTRARHGPCFLASEGQR
jgi:UDP-N-acetyl-D-glucosamine dehydrogenase